MNRVAESAVQASCFLGILLQGARLPAPLAASLSRVDQQALGVGAEQLAQVQSDRLKCHLHWEALPDHPLGTSPPTVCPLFSYAGCVYLKGGQGLCFAHNQGS